MCVSCLRRVAVHHVKVKPRCAVLTMLKRLDKIRFRGPRTREDFPDLAESPPASDNECNDDVQPKARSAPREGEELLRDPVRTRKLLCVFIIALQHSDLRDSKTNSHFILKMVKQALTVLKSMKSKNGKDPPFTQLIHEVEKHLYDAEITPVSTDKSV